VAALLQAQVGVPVLGCEQWDTASFVTSDLYNDVYRPQGLLHDIGVVLVRGAQHNAAFSMLRRTQEEPFAGDELRLITCLIPHLQRAAKLSLRFEQLQLDSAVAYEALDRLPFGLVLLDVHAAVLSMNGMAEDFIRQGDGLVFRNGGLSTLQPAESASLGSLIAEALATAAGTCLTGGGALAVTRPSGKRPFSVLISPMRSRSFDPGRRQCAALLVITDPERHAELPVEIIQRLLQLTRQEAALTVALAGGLDLKEVSQRLGISTHTAHTHLNRAMAKTSTHRQAELVALVYRTIVDLRCE
jgi:DNA-binding CsgD family transcriptional regulator